MLQLWTPSLILICHHGLCISCHRAWPQAGKTFALKFNQLREIFSFDSGGITTLVGLAIRSLHKKFDQSTLILQHFQSPLQPIIWKVLRNLWGVKDMNCTVLWSLGHWWEEWPISRASFIQLYSMHKLQWKKCLRRWKRLKVCNTQISFFRICWIKTASKLAKLLKNCIINFFWFLEH